MFWQPSEPATSLSWPIAASVVAVAFTHSPGSYPIPPACVSQLPPASGMAQPSAQPPATKRSPSPGPTWAWWSPEAEPVHARPHDPDQVASAVTWADAPGLSASNNVAIRTVAKAVSSRLAFLRMCSMSRMVSTPKRQQPGGFFFFCAYATLRLGLLRSPYPGLCWKGPPVRSPPNRWQAVKVDRRSRRLGGSR